MIKVVFSDYSNFGGVDYSYIKNIEGNLPEGVTEISASYDGGRGEAFINDECILDDLDAQDYSLSHKGVHISVDRGRFYCSAGENFNFEDLGAGTDFNFTLTQD